MKLIRTEAIVLKVSGRGAERVSLFAPDLGRVSAYVKPRRFPGMFTPLNLIDVQLRESSDGYIVVQVMPKEIFLNLRRHSRKLIVGLVLADIVDKALSGEPNERLFQVMVRMLRYIDSKKFSWSMLGLIVGFIINIILSHGLSLKDEELVGSLSSEERTLFIDVSVDTLGRLRKVSEQKPDLIISLIDKLMGYLEDKLGIKFGTRRMLSDLKAYLLNQESSEVGSV